MAYSSVVVPHVLRINRFLEMNILLSLQIENETFIKLNVFVQLSYREHEDGTTMVHIRSHNEPAQGSVINYVIKTGTTLAGYQPISAKITLANMVCLSHSLHTVTWQVTPRA